MPSATNDNHDGRYYTETEIDTELANYLLVDGTRAMTGELILDGNISATGSGIDFSAENLSNIGTVGCGAITATALTVDTTTLVVDAVNHWVEIGSADGSDKITISHNNDNAFIKWTDGDLRLDTAEGGTAASKVEIGGVSGGIGTIQVYDAANTHYAQYKCAGGRAFFQLLGDSPIGFFIQENGAVPINFFWDCASGVTQEVRIRGYREGDAQRALEIGVGVDAADTASFDGLSNYLFDGKIAFTQTDLNEYIGSLNDGYMDYRATTAHRFGDGTNQSVVSATGDITFAGTAGLAFGCLEGIDETITCTVQNTWYQVTFDAAGATNLVEADVANNELDVTNAGAGIYQVFVTACFHTNPSNDFELMVKKNEGTVDLGPHLFQTTAVANKVENACGACLIDVTGATDRIELWVRCTSAAAQNAVFDHVSLTIAQVGGT